MENYVETSSGTNFRFMDPPASDIHIADIAHALSLQVRFAGHIRKFYSVAEHSLNVARLVPNEHKLQALLHDASEAYLTDIPSPIKALLPDYLDMEHKVQTAICNKFGVGYPFDDTVHHADVACLIREAQEMLPVKDKNHWSFSYDSKYYLENKYIVGWAPEVVERLFLLRFDQYINKEYPVGS